MSHDNIDNVNNSQDDNLIALKEDSFKILFKDTTCKHTCCINGKYYTKNNTLNGWLDAILSASMCTDETAYPFDDNKFVLINEKRNYDFYYQELYDIPQSIKIKVANKNIFVDNVVAVAIAGTSLFVITFN